MQRLWHFDFGDYFRVPRSSSHSGLYQLALVHKCRSWGAEEMMHSHPTHILHSVFSHKSFFCLMSTLLSPCRICLTGHWWWLFLAVHGSLCFLVHYSAVPQDMNLKKLLSSCICFPSFLDLYCIAFASMKLFPILMPHNHELRVQS